jgi:hypothetical protein
MGYGTEEVIEFCVDFVPNLKPISLPQSHHEGRLTGKGMIRKKPMICRDGHSLTQAHYTVLQNSLLVAPYSEEYKNIVRSQNPRQSESFVLQLHMATFDDWLRGCLMNENDVEEQLYLLAKLSSSTILTFQGYEIKANTFYMVAQDKKRAPTKIVVSALMQ